MNKSKPFSVTNQALLSCLSASLLHHTLSHALLFHGTDDIASNELLRYMSGLILCHHPSNKPCWQCHSCRLIENHAHPDLIIIQPEKKLHAIKIEAIRDLYEPLYRSSQLGHGRVVLLHQAERLNIAASNALLKLLEEPPNNVYFLLQAAHLNTILPTILSRCQIWRITEEHTSTIPGLDSLGITLPEILADLQTVLTHQQIASIAAKWVNYDLSSLLRVLYGINAVLIKSLFSGEIDEQVSECNRLRPYLSLPMLFKQLDKLNAIIRHLNQSIALNPLLALEDFLLGYCKLD